jgi:signal transduction histidine kinase
MGCLAVDSTRQTHVVSVMSAALRKESRDRDTLLDQLSTDIYRSATLARDYMLEHDELPAASRKSELQSLRSRVEQALNQYRDNAPPREKQAVQSLQQHAESYWTSLSPALLWNRTARRQQGELFLRNTIIPRSDEVMEFAKQVNALDERVLDAAEERLQVVQARFQSRVRAIAILALALGSILAIVVVRHAQRLGIEANSRFNEVLAAREDLRRLSDRLVTVQEEERRNLSRELHDELGQAMSAILIELGNLDSALAGAQIRWDAMRTVRRMAEDNVAKVRNMALLLRPAMLDELGLVPALRWHAREVARRTGLKVKMIAGELNDDLPDAIRTCIFRVVQEAINNCVKHSQATEVRVMIHRDGDGLSISVQDNGVGFDPAGNRGLGLLGMMERVSGLGGQFQIKSEPGHGTILSAFFQLENNRCQPVEESVA